MFEKLDHEPTRADYETQTKRPGMFEGEAAYVPYFWHVYLDGGADRDDGRRLFFDVGRQDKRLFPELRRRRVVVLIQREDGFVCEV